jgi:hypothetical protein
MYPLLFDDVVVAAPSLFTPEVDALINSASADFIVLVEIQPMERLSVWTAVGGATPNVYYCDFPSQIATEAGGGIYRRLDFVRQNSTPLTSLSSIAAVNGALASYYLDTSLNRLYVATTTGASPDTFALLGAWFTLFFSTSSVSLSGQPLYLPIVTGSLPTVTEEMPDSLFGSMVSETGEVSFLNGDKLFDRISSQYVWRNKTATFKLGGAGLAYSAYTTVTKMRINAVAVNDEVCTLTLETMSSVLNRQLPIRTWGENADASNAIDPAQGFNGVFQPIVLGTVIAAPTSFGGSGGGFETWWVYDHDIVTAYAVSTPTAVFAVDKQSKIGVQLIDGGDFVTSGDRQWIAVVLASFPHDQYDIVVVVFNAGIVFPFFGSMARALLEICGESTANIDTAAFTAADSHWRFLARYLNEPRSGFDWMMELCQSVNGQVYVGSDGRWTCRLLTPDIPAPSLLVSLTDVEGDFVSWDPVETLATSLNEVRVRHSHRPYSDEWTEATASSDTIRYGNETNDSHRIDTWLTNADDATAHAQHLRFFKSQPPNLIAIEERGLKLMNSHAGDLVSVTRARAPVARTGRYDGHILRIQKIEKNLGPEAPTVRVILNDLDGQADRIFRLAPSGSTITWSTATAQEKARYGFLADTNRYLGGVKDQKVLW